MLWKHLDANFNKTMPFIEQSVNKWNNRTQLLGGMKKASSAFNQSIMQQVNGVLATGSAREKAIAKT
jgi:hypothetical protein